MLRNDELVQTLGRVAEGLLVGTTGTDMVSQLRVHVWELLRNGDSSLESLARNLGQSPRTLQRRLASEGTSHRELLDQVRSTLAAHLLADDNQRLLNVALILGFADQASFHRAIRRWTQSSPGRFRRRTPV